jgi:hypothetical protein
MRLAIAEVEIGVETDFDADGASVRDAKCGGSRLEK